MTLSVIIPTRNRKSMTGRAIDSVLSQEQPADEIIVVDDNSVDGTGSWVAEHYPQVRVLSGDGRGPGPARDIGVRASQGDCLFFLDSDDIWTKDHIARLLDLHSRGFEVVYGITRTINELDKTVFDIPARNQGGTGECFADLSRWCFLVPSGAAVGRKAYDTVGGFGEEDYGEDWLFFLKLAHVYEFGFWSAHITTRFLHAESRSYLEDMGDRIPGLVRNLEELVQRLRPQDQSLKDFFSKHKQIINKEFRQWQTVQDWYLSLKKHNLL